MEYAEKSRVLALVASITNVLPIANADNIECVTILGWQSVVKRGDFKVGDIVIYFSIDSWLPIDNRYEFLRKNCYRKNELGEGFRIRTVKLRGQISQGLVMSIDNFPELTSENRAVGSDVTEILNVKKYDIPIPAQLMGMIRGPFPSHLVPKTDELRIQSYPEFLELFKGREVYWSVKMDGTSGTFINAPQSDGLGDFHVCSRNMSLKETEGNIYWKMANKYDLRNKIQVGYAIQGEICGPGIQKNRLMLTDHELFVFNVYDINNRRYFNLGELESFCKGNSLQMVKVEGRGIFNYTMDEVIQRGTTCMYNTANSSNGEGYVIRPVDDIRLDSVPISLGAGVTINRDINTLSCKIINNNYLIEHGE